MTRTFILWAGCLSASALLHDDATANQIVNGSFENATSGSPNVWSYTGHLTVVNHQGVTDGALALAFSFANVPSNAVLWQTFSTAANTRFGLAFDFGKYSISQPLQSARIEVDVFDGAGFGGSHLLHKLVIDSTPGPGDPNSTNSPAVYSPYQFAFLAASSSATLRFRDISDPQVAGGGFDAMLDDVQIAATPEPSTFVLAAMGLCSLVFMGVRRRSRPAA